MLDIQYLLERPRISRPIVYRYRTGVLRRQMVAALRELALSEGGTPSSCGPHNLVDRLREGSWSSLLGQTLTVCDWKGLSRSIEKHIAANVLTAFAALADEGFALFIVNDSHLTKHELWSMVEARSLIIEEPEITRQTLMPVLRYLDNSTDLGSDMRMSEQPSFVESFDEFLLDGGDLSDLVQAFDDRVLTCTDPETSIFDARRFKTRQLWHRGLRPPSSLLRDLIAGGGGWEIVALVTGFDDRHQQQGSAEDVLAHIHSITRRLLQDREAVSLRGKRRRAGTPNQAEDHRQDREILVWACLVLAWDGRLRQVARSSLNCARRVPSVLMTALDQLGRAFVERAARATMADGLVGLWPEMEATWAAVALSETDRLGATREQTVRALVGRLASVSSDPDQRWQTRLLREATEALEAANRESERRVAEDEQASDNAESERE